MALHQQPSLEHPTEDLEPLVAALVSRASNIYLVQNLFPSILLPILMHSSDTCLMIIGFTNLHQWHYNCGRPTVHALA